MVKYTIYAWTPNGYDLSKWVELSQDSLTRCRVGIVDRGHETGGPSFSCSLQHVMFAIDGFTYQVSAEDGFCSMSSDDATVLVEYKSGNEDSSALELKKDDLRKAVSDLGFSGLAQPGGFLF